jgi:hypothetical protein
MAKKYPHEEYYDRKRFVEDAGKGQPEGFSTQKNIKQWSARATANSYPNSTPKTQNKIAVNDRGVIAKKGRR